MYLDPIPTLVGARLDAAGVSDYMRSGWALAWKKISMAGLMPGQKRGM